MRNYFISGHHYIQDVVLEAGTYTFWAYIKSDFGNTFTFALVTVLPVTPPSLGSFAFLSVHPSFNIKVRSPYVDAYKAATNWRSYSSKISAI